MRHPVLTPSRLARVLGAALALPSLPALAADCVSGGAGYATTTDCSVPARVTSITIEAWGAGGAGGANGNGTTGGGGGGGGAYCKATFAVTPGTILRAQPGTGGHAPSPGGQPSPGIASTVIGTGISGFSARGGQGGGTGSVGYNGNLGGAGGDTSSCTAPGAIAFAGGAGGTSIVPTSGGGGGGSATPTAAGSDGQSNGAAGTGQAAGGAGATNTPRTAGRYGASPGGGGGGSLANNYVLYGGGGGDGLVKFSYTVPALAVPSAPDTPSAISGDNSARVTWAAPSNDGGSPITGYTVVGTPAGSCAVGAGATSCTITGLTNDVPHSFTVVATNAQGGSDPSVPASTIPRVTNNSPSLSVPSGGTASVLVRGGQPGCALSSSPSILTGGAIPAGAPAGAAFPLGAVAFNANGCTGDTLTVSVTYSNDLPSGTQLMKYGPRTAGASTSEWFPAPGAVIDTTAKTITYTVTDNGPGDSNPAPGVIADPVALMAMPPAGGAQAIPTLNEWCLALLSLLAAAFGMRAARRQRL